MRGKGSANKTKTCWETWVSQHLSHFYLFARQQTRTDGDAEDVLQEAILEAWKRNQEGEPCKTLVFSYIRRRAIDLGRKIQVRQNFAEDQPSELDWIEVDYARRDEAIQLRQMLAELKPEFTEVVVLHIWGGLTFAEVGVVLDISPNTAASRYRQALTKLKNQFKVKAD